ncbi:MAG: hypothetical protein ACI8PZ_003894 [Myxococcota bacterium]|jgi:hypothetical protein
MTRHLLILFTLACGGGDTYEDDTLPTTPATSETTVPELVCDPPGPSACGSEGSMIRGQVRVAPGTEGDLTGDVFIGLTHEWLGNGEEGGFPHISATYPGVDLAQGPVEFEFDMCDGGEMWSEENCSYQLIVILDQDGDQALENMVPGKNELVGRVADLYVSCDVESPCLDVVLDCTGPKCTRFDDPGQCACSAFSCDSDIVTCF